MITIRALAEGDLDQVEALAEESQAEGFAFVLRFRDDMRARTIALAHSREYFLGAFDNGQLVAIGGVTPDPHVEDTTVGRIRRFYVTRRARRRGIGRQLLGALEARAQSVYRVLRLRTDTTEAASFYQSLGFDPVNERDATHRREVRGSRSCGLERGMSQHNLSPCEDFES